MRFTCYMAKIGTFDAGTFWKNAYAHQRGKLLKRVSVPDDQIIELVNKFDLYFKDFLKHIVLSIKIVHY